MPRGNAKAPAAVQTPITQSPTSFEQELMDDPDFPSHLSDEIEFKEPKNNAFGTQGPVGSQGYPGHYSETSYQSSEGQYDDDEVLEEEEPLDEDDQILEEELTAVQPVIFTLIKEKGVKPNLTTEDGTPLDDGYPQTYYIPHSDVITYRGDDEDHNGKSYNGRQRTIRYISGESSIYKDEQSDDAQPTFGEIVFNKGILRVHPDDNPLMLEYLRNMNHNDTNPNAVRRKKVFFELITGKVEREEEDTIELEYQAITKVKDLRNVDLLVYCKYFEIPTRGKKVIQLKVELKKFAKRNPKDFLQTFSDPMFKIKQVFILAQDRRIVTYSEIPNTLAWISGSDRTPIINWPIGEDKMDFLAKWATSKQGNSYFTRIKDMLKEVSK